jgi:hypothetical protein
MKSWKSGLGLGALAMVAFVFTPACSSSDDGQPDEDSEAQVRGTPVWNACSVDSDCIAVEKHSCCELNAKEAVNKDKVAEYDASWNPRPCLVVACALTQYTATEAPQCNSGRCQMVDVSKIACGGHSPNPHSCPTGYACEGASLAVDAPGSCVAEKKACGDRVCGADQWCSFCWGKLACMPKGALC